jgi:hypothetical protein
MKAPVYPHSDTTLGRDMRDWEEKHPDLWHCEGRYGYHDGPCNSFPCSKVLIHPDDPWKEK